MEKIKENFSPLVSIVIPVYNGSNYMREAIDSALAQTYKNIEVIVVNDGSTDSTEEIAKSYGDKIRYFAKENGGVATALNLAIKNAKGEYISWLSHDDVYYDNKIEKQIGRLSEIEENDRVNTIVWSNYSLINEKSQITHRQQFEKMHSQDKLDYPLYGVLNGLVHGCTLLIPKHCFDDVGYFDEKLKTTQDYDLWFRMFPKYEMVFMSDSFVKSRWHVDQGSKKITTATQEADALWIKMIDNLTVDQMISLSGSQMSFYQKTRVLMDGAGYFGAKKYLLSKIDNFKNRDISGIRVSIIIPFFNRIGWTIQALKSVLCQTHKNIEIILVNDHSTEDISQIEVFIKNDSRIKFLTNKRSKGVSGARNTGIDEASGEYIAFLDSDDLFLPEKIETQLRFMVRHGYAFSHTSYRLFGDAKNFGKIMWSGNIDYGFPQIISGCSIATPTVMIHKDFLKDKTHRFPEDISLGEDVCFWISLSRISPCYGIRSYLTRVRTHGFNAAFDTEKQIRGISNILNYVTGRYFNGVTIKYVLNLEQLLRHHLIKYEKKNDGYTRRSFTLTVIIRKAKKIIKIVLCFISPSFNLLQENKSRFVLLENNLEKLENILQKK